MSEVLRDLIQWIMKALSEIPVEFVVYLHRVNEPGVNFKLSLNIG